MSEGKKGKWVRVDPHLRLAVALEFPTPAVYWDGIVDIRSSKPGIRELYLDMRGNSPTPKKIVLKMPVGLVQRALCGQIVFNDNIHGAGVCFGRKGEKASFFPSMMVGGVEVEQKGGYLPLRLYREKEHPFNPVYVCIDEGNKTRFLLVEARWVDDTITIDVDHNPARADIPSFFF